MTGMIGILLSAGALLWWAPAGAQDARAGEETFRIQVGTMISGSESFHIRKTEGGFTVTGRARMQRPGAPMEMNHEQELDAQWRPIRYKLEAAGGPRQVIEAARTDTGFRMQVDVGGKARQQNAEARDGTVVLDNMVVSHYQVLLNMVAGTAAGKIPLWLLVPQRLAAVAGTLTAAGDAVGTLEGRAIRLRKYSLEIAAILVEIWAERDSHRLMRVTVPLQQVEMAREGFVLDDEPAATEAAAPSYREEDAGFSSGGLEIPGTLCMPARSSGAVPGVVLVAGSGPNDRDETIGPNKPFRDIARGLADRGIAVLRYDKRTFAFREKMDAKTVASMTVQEEVIDDAVAALSYLRSLEGVDPGKVFLLGHSLGASLAPFIADGAGPVRGVILMAPAARPLDELIYDQARTQMKLQGQPESAIEAAVGKLRTAFAGVRSGELPDSAVVFYASARYWRDLFSRDTVAALGRLEQPALLLQGGKDIQVTGLEFELVRKAFSGSHPGRLEAHLFPDLNHLFMKVEGAATGAEYGRPGRVTPEVIQTIASWIDKVAAR